eukprot:CFRG1869T1
MALPNDGSFLARFQNMKQTKKANPTPKSTPSSASASSSSNSKAGVSLQLSRPTLAAKTAFNNTTGHASENSTSNLSSDSQKIQRCEKDEVAPAYQPIKAPSDPKVLATIESLASKVVAHECNIISLRNQHEGDDHYKFLFTDSIHYTYFVKRIEYHSQVADAFSQAKEKAALSESSASNNSTIASNISTTDEGTRKRKRKSRWGDGPSTNSPQQSQSTASSTLSNENVADVERPDIAEGGYDERKEEKNFNRAAWIHEQRRKEMEMTAERARQLTEANKGKRHMSDYLPKEELDKFMRKAEAIKTGNMDYDDSEYQSHKITEENVGYQMVEQDGWEEGLGLGAEHQGIKVPISRAAATGGMGLGSANVGEIKKDDDEFELYRKRMMLAYKFRPNPLNNPRRAYY